MRSDPTPLLPTSAARAPRRGAVRRRALALAAVCSCALVLLVLVLAPRSGLSHSEGQRVEPAWEMLASGDWTVPRLFGQAYLRKPPGVPWAIALSGALLGRSVFAARLVSISSIVLAALVSGAAAGRWFGPRAGLIAAASFLVFPVWYWYPPVMLSAEIEAMHVLWTLLTSLLVIEALLGRTLRPNAPHRHRRAAMLFGLLAASSSAMTLTKGPAGLVCAVPSLLVPLVLITARGLLRSHGTFLRAFTVLGGLVLGAMSLWAWQRRAQELLTRTRETAMTQNPGEFLFGEDWSYAGFVLGVGFAGIPFLFAALDLLRSHSHSQPLATSPSSASEPDRNMPASAVAIVFAAGWLLTPIVGLSNPRYGTPILALLPVIFAGWCGQAQRFKRYTPARQRPLARHTGALLCGLALLCAALAVYADNRRATRTTGELDGLKLGAVLRGPAELWGDELMDQRPEIAMSAVRAACARGQSIRPRWKPVALQSSLAEVAMPPLGSYLLVREDTLPREKDNRPELPSYLRAGLLGKCERVFEGSAHNFLYRVYQRTVE